MRRDIAVGFALLLASLGCQKTESPQQMQARMEHETQQFQQAAAAVERRWEAWTAAGQADSFPQVFMEQGREMPPNAPNVVGRNAIRAFHAQYAAAGSTTIHIVQESATASGDHGMERGMFTTEFTPGPNAPPGILPADTGKYVTHWQRVNGEWLVHDLIWNSNLPVPAPAAAPRRR